MIGAALREGDALMQVDMTAPTPSCMNPSIAEALPAFFEKGISATDAALGYVMPAQPRKRKNSNIVGKSPRAPAALPAAKRPIV